MRSIRRSAAVLLALAFAFAQPSLAAPEPKRAAKPAKSTETPATVLTIAAYPPFDEGLKAVVPRYEALHPEVKVEVRSLAFGDHHGAMIKALASGAELPDVMAVEIGYVGRFAESGGLADLAAPPYDGEPLLEKLLAFTAPQARSGADLLAAIPADTGPGTLFYRKDLLDQAGVTEEDLTRSWESFIEAGKKVKAATGASLVANANEVKDIYIRATVDEGDGIFFDRDGRAAVDSPRFERAFALARKIRAAGLDAKAGAWSKEWADGIRNGTIATVPAGSWLAGHLENWLAPDTRGKWRAAQLPGGAFAAWGGSFLAIPAKAEHRREAWDFIRLFCLDREAQLRDARATGMWPALKAAQDEPAFVDVPLPFLGGQKARRLWKESAASIPALPMNRLDPVASDVVAAELEQVLEKDKEIRAALADAQDQLERRVRGAGGERSSTGGVARSGTRAIVLTVASYPSFDESVKVAFPRWSKLHPDIQVKLVSLPFGDHHKAMITALASGQSLPDVMAIEAGFIGRLAESRLLEDLAAAPYGAEDRLGELLDFTVPLGRGRGRILAGLPIDAGPGTLFYRKDLLDKAGVTEDDLTGSWDSFLEAGERLKAATGAALVAHAQDVADLVMRTGLAEGEGVYFDAAGRPRVDGPRFRRAFELAKRVREAGLDARAGAWSNAWADGIKRGEIATLPAGAWLLGHLTYWLAPDLKGRWRAAPLPGGAKAAWGGSFFAIPRGAAHKREAWEFLRFMAFDREQQVEAFTMLDAWPVLKEAQDAETVDAPIPYLGGQRARRLFKQAAAQLPAVEPNRLDPIAIDVLHAELEQVLEHGKDVQQALDDAQRTIERKLRK
jgi:multiple sugar transport system substrate-binding protein